MGTRGLYGVVVNGEVKASYNHFDSYPSGLGADIVKFVQGIENVSDVFEQAQNLTLVIENDTAPSGDDWYSELRGIQGDLGAHLAHGHLIDNESFGRDSVFCEWGYLVNLDDETVEVYRGFQTEPHTEGRWSDYDPAADESVSYRPNHYYGIKRIAVIPFADLTEEVMTALEFEEEEED